MSAGVRGRHRELAQLERLMDKVYSEPFPLDTLEAFERAQHRDIPKLSSERIAAELLLARYRLAVLVHHRGQPSAWLVERITRLEDASRR